MPAQAIRSQVLSAHGFLASLPDQGPSDSLDQDLLTGLRFAERSEAKHKVLIYVGSGEVFRGAPLRQILQRVSAANKKIVRIHTLGVAVSQYPEREEFLRALAAQNGGTYRRLN